MAQEGLRLPPLIADPDFDYLIKIGLDRRAKDLPPVMSSSAQQTADLLSNPSVELSAIFLNPGIQVSNAAQLVKMATTRRPSTPIFFIVDNKSHRISAADLERLSGQKVIYKPANYLDLLKAANLGRGDIDAEKVIEHAKKNLDPISQQVPIADHEMVAIRAEQFLCGRVSLFDVYVRLVKDRYVKIIQAGAEFEAERSNEYIDRGVKNFYLRADVQSHYLKYCGHLNSVVMQKSGIPSTVKMGLLLNQGEEAAKYILDAGLDPSGVEHARSFVENAMEFVHKLELKKENLCQLFFDNRRFGQEVLMTTASLAMAGQLGFLSDKSYEIVGLAAFLHDVGLDPVLATKVEATGIAGLNAKEKEEYFQHPLRGARMLSEIEGMSESVVEAVAQHHERRGQTGFPNRVSKMAIGYLSELVAVSDEFVKVLKRAESIQVLRALVHTELAEKQHFSQSMVSALEVLFLKVF